MGEGYVLAVCSFDFEGIRLFFEGDFSKQPTIFAGFLFQKFLIEMNYSREYIILNIRTYKFVDFTNFTHFAHANVSLSFY